MPCRLTRLRLRFALLLALAVPLGCQSRASSKGAAVADVQSDAPISDAALVVDSAAKPDAAPSCFGTNVCEAKGQYCEPLFGNCVECMADLHCPSGHCNNHFCAPGQPCTETGPLCSAAGLMLSCDATTGVWQEKACPAGQLCTIDSCKDAICVPGSKTCVDNEPKTCNTDGTAYEAGAFEVNGKLIVGGCPSPLLCEAGNCVAKPCPATPGVCQGNVFVACAAGKWTVLGSCGSKTCTPWGCSEAACQPGEVTCAGLARVACGSGGTFSQLEDCAAQQKSCQKGQCQPWVCTPYSDFCVGNTAVRCDSSGLGWVGTGNCSEVPGQGCFDGACVDLPCSATVAGCAGDKVVLCGSSGLQAIKDCGTQACIGGECAPPVCLAGDSTCTGNELWVCHGGSKWSLMRDCAKSGQKCADGDCQGDCQVGSTFCYSGMAATCDAGVYPVVTEVCYLTAKTCVDGACK